MPGELIEVEVGRVCVPYPVPARSIIGGHVVVYGWSIKETSGTAVAELDIFDGTDNTGLLALPLGLAAGAPSTVWLGPQGLHLRNGLFSTVAGALAGSLFVNLEADEHRYHR